MKLKNKKTGEICEVLTDSIAVNVLIDNHDMTGYYTSLAELNEEWEDAPEKQKEYWSINELGSIVHIAHSRENTFDKARKEFGNYFETEEEVEKAVEKLKAVKRLKAKEFRFTNWEFRDVLDGNLVIEAKLNFDNSNNIQRDLEICFGGEE